MFGKNNFKVRKLQQLIETPSIKIAARPVSTNTFILLSDIYISPNVSTDNIDCIIYVMFNRYFAGWNLCFRTGHRQDEQKTHTHPFR